MSKKLNNKKIAAGSLENALLKVRNLLLQTDPTKLKTFNSSVDRIRRSISDSRDSKNNPQKGVYPVQIATNFRVVSRLLQPLEIKDISEIADHSRDDVIISSLGLKFKDQIVALLEPEKEIFEALNENEMKSGFYMGVDCNPQKD